VKKYINKQIERLAYIRLRLGIAYYKALSSFVVLFSALYRKKTKKYELGLYPYAQKGSDGYTRRFEEYFRFLQQDNIKFKVFDICSDIEFIYNINLGKKKTYDFYLFVLKKRFSQVLEIRHCYTAFIHRNLYPFYPDQNFPFLEKMAYKLCDNITIDYWDSVWFYNMALVEKTVKYCHKLSVVNEFIFEHFRYSTPKRFIFPIGVNIDKYIIKKDYNCSEPGVLTFFYTGLPGNVKEMLKELDSVFLELSKSISLKLILVSRESIEHQYIKIEHHTFDENIFFELLTKADIGIYAIDNSDISRGKMAMKVLDYFAAALPCIASPYGITPFAIHKENCLIAKTKDEWIECILMLYNDKNYRESIGKAGRITIEEKHNLRDSYSLFISIINPVSESVIKNNNSLELKKFILNIYLFFCLYLCILVTKLIPLFIKKKAIQVQKKDILFLECTPIENAGYNYRSKKWTDKLSESGLKCEVKTLFEDRYQFERHIKKENLTVFYVKSMSRRLRQCVYARNFKTVIVRRELLLFNDYGNLFMEKLLFKIHDNIILDFDDDVAASKRQPKQVTSFYGKMMFENGNKFSDSFSYYQKFITASDYLKMQLLNRNNLVDPNNILIIPTCVDYDKYTHKNYPIKIDRICFGWIGGDYNYFLLDLLIPVLNKLSQKFNFCLIVIGGKKYQAEANFDIEFIPWSLDTEIESLYKIDVGLMPLEDDFVNRGKSGFKLIQYMGLGIVSIATGLTINNEIIDDRENSFIIKSFEEWEIVLTEILNKKIDFKEIGKLARQKIESNYTFKANFDRYYNFVKGN